VWTSEDKKVYFKENTAFLWNLNGLNTVIVAAKCPNRYIYSGHLVVSAIILYGIMTSYIFRPSVCMTMTSYMFRLSFCLTEWPPTCFGHHFVWHNDLLHVSALILYDHDLLHVSAIILFDRMTSYMFRRSIICMTEWPPTCFGHRFVWHNDLLHVSAIILYGRMTYMFRPSFCMTEWPPTCFSHQFHVWQNDLLHVSAIILYVWQNDLLQVSATILDDIMSYMFRRSVCMCNGMTSYIFRPSVCMRWLFWYFVNFTFYVSTLCVLPPWGWPRGWPKHVGGHCVYNSFNRLLFILLSLLWCVID